MHILKESGIDWHERRLISKFCMDQSVELKLDQQKIRSVKNGRGVRQGCCLSLILFNLYSEYLTIKVLEASGDFKIGQVICNVRYADDLVLLAKEEMVLYSMTDRLIRIEDAMEKNECGKKSGNENHKAPIPSKDYNRLKTTRECGILFE
jgi:hypothetical protein